MKHEAIADARAAEHNLIAALTTWAAAGDGGARERRDGAILAGCSAPMRSFNNVLIAREPEDLERLVEYAGRFFARGDGRYRLRVREDVVPIGDDAFLHVGLTRFGGIPCLAMEPRDAHAAAADGLSMRQVDDARTVDDHVRVVAQGFDFDPEQLARALTPRLLEDGAWRGYVGYAGGAPVATSQLVVSGTTAGIYYVATVESARGRGFGAAITARATADAAALGCRTISLQASPMGLPIYERLGFRRVAYYRTYVPAS